MKDFLRRFAFPAWSVPLALLALCILSYTLLIRYLGYYWDDWPFIWISQKLGSEGLIRYFHTNRPIWGLLFQFTTPLLGHEPWRWHLFALLWRWIASVLLWLLLRLLWPRHPQPALWTSMLFAVYPGSQEQLIALVFSHFFIVLSAFLASLSCALLALRRPRLYVPFTLLGLTLALLNLLSMEYFFLLELLRPALLWVAASGNQTQRQRLLQTVRHSLPYLLLFGGVIVWRAFFFSFQTTNYSFSLLDSLRSAPLATLLSLVVTVLRDLWLTTLGAWGRTFLLPNPAVLGRLTTLVYAALVLVTLAGTFLYLFFSRKRDQEENTAAKKIASWAPAALLLGLLGLLLAGPPYWLTGLEVSLNFPNSRVTLSFMLGASLFLAGLLGLMPVPRGVRLAALALLLSLSAGQHFRNANTFRRDDSVQKALFWQMAWRMPTLEPGTALLINELPLHYSTDNSLTATLNWIYAPENNSAQMDYYLYYPEMRLETSLPPLESGATIEQDYLAAMFYGSTQQVVALYFEPPGCLRVLDPEIEPANPMLPVIMRSTAEHATLDPILAGEGKEAALQEDIFGAELAHGWCYYFQKADLARQMGDWEEVAALGEIAFALNDYPNDPAERLPFIEGYAHVENWPRALELTGESYQVTALMQAPLCRLWDRIETQTADFPEKVQAVMEAKALLGCD